MLSRLIHVIGWKSNQYFVPSYYYAVFCCMELPQCVYHSPVNRRFQLPAVVNKAAMLSAYRALCGYMFPLLISEYSEVQLPGQTISCLQVLSSSFTTLCVLTPSPTSSLPTLHLYQHHQNIIHISAVRGLEKKKSKTYKQ